MSNELIAITYTEFDNIVGTQLKYSYPPGAISKEVFELFSDYVIVAKQLCQRFIVVALEDVIFLNYPISIDNPKYYRNNLAFSFGLVLPRNVDCDPFETVLKKLSSSFANLEIETEFIFQPHSKRLIQDILKTMYESFRDGCEAFIYLTEAKRYLAFKLYKSPVQVSYVRDYDVPIFRYDRINLSSIPWDISFQHLVHRIDGLSHVKKISKDADMDPDFVKRSLSLLAFYDVVVIADVFKFTNVYKLDYEELSDLMSDPAGLFAMQEFCTVDSTVASDHPTLDQILKFVFKLRPGWSIRDILLEIAAPSSGPDAEASAKLEEDEDERQRAYSSSSGVSGYSTRTGVGGSNTSRSNSISNPPNYLNNTGISYNSAANAAMGVGRSGSFASAMSGGRTGSFASAGSATVSILTPTPGEGLSGLKNIDICRLLSFLCSKKVARRVHEYPMYVPPNECEMKGADAVSTTHRRESGGSGVGNSGGGDDNDLGRRQQQEEGEPGLSTATVESKHTFQKLSSRSKSVIGRNYLKTAGETTSSFPISIKEIVQSFQGDECLDSICCKYEVSFNDIVSYPGVYLVYK